MTHGRPDAPPARRRLAFASTLGACLLLVSACGSITSSPSAEGSAEASPSDATAGSAAPSSSGPTGLRLGISNTRVGDGWGEALICSIKAQALASGDVADLMISSRDTDAEGQLADVRNLISSGVDAIIVDPLSPKDLVPAAKEAIAAGIPVVSVGQPIPQAGAYSMGNGQESYGYQGAVWLFETMQGKGDVIYLRGTKGDPVDEQRDAGFHRALAAYPDIKVALEVQTGGDPAVAVEQINNLIAAGTTFDGIWTSGIDSVVVDALKIAGHAYVPIVGADHGAFVSQLLSEEGLVGAAVTDPAAVGGAAVALALKVIGGTPPATPDTLLTPERWENVTDAGRAQLTAANDPDIDLTWPLLISLPGWTTYTKDQLLACQGPGGG